MAGTKVTISRGKVKVPNDPIIPFIEGDGIGPEIVTEAVRVLATLRDDYDLDIEMDEALIGGTAYDAAGHPL